MSGCSWFIPVLMWPKLVFVPPILTFIAFLLIFLVSLSLPIIKTIWLFRLAASASTSILNASATASVRFGVWGYCTSDVDVSALGFNHDTPGSCSPAKLGFKLDDNVQSALRESGLDPNTISKSATTALVLHPIVCVFTFLWLLKTLYVVYRRNRDNSRNLFCSLFMGLAAVIPAWIVFFIDVIVVAIAGKDIKKDTDGVISLEWGNAVWMTLGTAIALTLAMVISALVTGQSTRRKRVDPY